MVAVPRPLCGSATRLTLQDTGITRTLTTSPWLYIIDRPVHIVSQLRDSSVRRVFVLDIILSSPLLFSPRLAASTSSPPLLSRNPLSSLYNISLLECVVGCNKILFTNVHTYIDVVNFVLTV